MLAASGRLQQLLLQQLPRAGSATSTTTSLPCAWVQHLLDRSCSAMHTSSSSSTSSSQAAAAAATTPPPQQRKQQQQQLPHWKTASTPLFSIRPSALSPLHPLHRELQEVEQRLSLLSITLQAHLKLSEELQPQELASQEAAGSDAPVADALAARRAALQRAADATAALLEYRVQAADSLAGAKGYYGLLEGLLRGRDGDAREFKEVAEGSRSIWEYWFSHFSPQYAGLPGLGRLESIYNQVDEEEMVQQLARLRAATDKPEPQPQVDHLGRASASGARKTSSAAVLLWRGSGRMLVNGKPLDAYFNDVLLRSAVLRPLAATRLTGGVDVLARVRGGGASGQAQAVAHGIARALRRLDPGLRPVLRAAGLLKRDPRMVERKKFGRAKARKRFAWVKR